MLKFCKTPKLLIQIALQVKLEDFVLDLQNYNKTDVFL
jgi:hypothetical protein